MDDITLRIWQWLPARRDRGRVTAPTVAAANLGITVEQAAQAMDSMRRSGHIVPDKSGWHRGVKPC